MTQQPFQPAWARAAQDRPNIAKAEMRDIVAHFDNGVNQGAVIVVGPWTAGVVQVRVLGQSERFRVAICSLTVDAATAKHLERETEEIATYTEVAVFGRFLTGGGCRASRFFGGGARG